jgi:hypothetical protein
MKRPKKDDVGSSDDPAKAALPSLTHVQGFRTDDDGEISEFYEMYGIRSGSLALFDGERRLFPDKVQTITAFASDLLRENNIPSHDEVIAQVTRYFAESSAVKHATTLEKLNRRMSEEKNRYSEVSYAADVETTLERWPNFVARVNGRLHPVTSAATFLELNRQILKDFIDATGIDPKNPTEMATFDRLHNQIFRLCDAWHWLHMECFGEHEQAVVGVRAAAGRKKGSQSVRTKAKARTAIVDGAIRSIYTRRMEQKRPSNRLSAPFIAKQMLATVNAQCGSHNPPLDQFTQRSLADAIRKLVK